MTASLLPAERDALERFRADLLEPARSDADERATLASHGGDPALEERAWTTFVLRTVLLAGRRVRAGTPALLRLKGDGSPSTELERQVEEEIGAALGAFAPEAVLVGEETGGRLGAARWALSVDPIDGTWAFLSHTETFSVVITLFRDGRPYLGVVGSPLLGEVGYAVAGGTTRLVRLDLFGEGDEACSLPLADRDPQKVLVHLHPSPAGSRLMAAMFGAWARGRVRMVRAPGGSPSWGLLEAARGHFTYVNEWARSPADPWDLAAGVLLVNGSGGAVVDLDARPIDPVGHRGPFVAGVSPEHRARVVEIAREALDR